MDQISGGGRSGATGRHYKFKSVGKSTKVTFVLDFQPRGLAKWMDGMITRTMQAEVLWKYIQRENIPEVFKSYPDLQLVLFFSGLNLSLNMPIRLVVMQMENIRPCTRIAPVTVESRKG